MEPEPTECDWSQSYDEWAELLTKLPILERIYNAGVFSCGLSSGGNVGFVEECDRWNAITLSSVEVRQLANELLQIADEAERATAPK